MKCLYKSEFLEYKGVICARIEEPTQHRVTWLYGMIRFRGRPQIFAVTQQELDTGEITIEEKHQ